MSVGDEPLNHGHLQRNVFNGGRLCVGGQEIECCAIVVEFLCPFGGELAQRETFRLRATNGFVVNIGEVTDVANGETVHLQASAQYVLKNEGAEIADMCWRINGGATAIHPIRGLRLSGRERFQLAAKGIVKSNGHAVFC
jgi:hypothetical protein